MKFYMTPGSCSTGIHILLEEIGLLFEVYPINLLAGDQFKPEYLAINPRATVPTLVTDDGRPITDFKGIAWWLAREFPRARLLPENPEQESRIQEVMDLALNNLHGQGFARIFTTERFTIDEDEKPRVVGQGKAIVTRMFAAVDKLLDGQDYVVDHFTIADAALFYVEFWADRLHLPLPNNCLRHYHNMLKRPAVRQVLMEEGYHSTLNVA